MKTQLYTQLRSVARAKYSSPSTGILGTHNVTSSQLADSSVARELHRYRRGHGFESRSGLNFFQVLVSQLLKLCV